MKYIIISVDDEVYAAAHRKAAAHNTSVNQLVADYLNSLRDEKELYVERSKRLEELFASQDRRFQNEPVGRMKREEIYGGGEDCGKCRLRLKSQERAKN